MNTFRGAAEIARAARHPDLLANAALGVSGGRGGSGDSFDRADEERLAALRDAEHPLTSDDPALKLEVVIRLMAELHFDASFQAIRSERTLMLLQIKFCRWWMTPPCGELRSGELKGAAPTDSLDDRLKTARDVMTSAREQQDINTEIEAGCAISFLMENGEFDQAVEERGLLCEDRIPHVPDAGKRQRFEWQDTVLSRTELLYQGPSTVPAVSSNRNRTKTM